MPDPSPKRPDADRNLLIGIMALQMDFINRDALIKVINAWKESDGWVACPRLCVDMRGTPRSIEFPRREESRRSRQGPCDYRVILGVRCVVLWS
jgi:hypothetical protein